MNECVTFDYEPWSIPSNPKSFDPKIRNAFARWAGLKRVPDRQEITSTYNRQWIDFWLHVADNEYSAMSKAVRTHHPDPNATRVAFTYFFPYDDEDKLYRRFWSVPKDPRRAEKFYDVHLISMYITNRRELVDNMAIARKYLRKPIWGISSLSRVTPAESYTSPEHCLSPQQLEQKIVLCAALGTERHGLWPGRGWIDGRYLEAIGYASRFVRQHEPFYFDGTSAPAAAGVQPATKATREQWAHTVHRAGNRVLVTLFNFSDRPMAFRVSSPKTAAPDTLSVPPHGFFSKTYLHAAD